MKKFEIVEKLENISKAILANEDNFSQVDDLLDDRDNDVFSTQWMVEFDNVEKLKVSSESLGVDDALLERIFKDVFSKSSSSELASYVSDDFGLLIDAVSVGYESKWLTALWDSYVVGVIPGGEIDMQR
ncbi:hypothetical protein [Myroides sp. N17-2]|uniref:hypothetical protein n=1 Tax=Myroides sp. N17-2 TaxID=2030799 RepID=UPI000EFBDDFE|nr:hypothetical protein [Myroides sp. N17-2]